MVVISFDIIGPMRGSNAFQEIRVALVLSDVIMVAISFVFAYYMRTHLDTRPFYFQPDLLSFTVIPLMLVPVWLGVNLLSGLYSREVFIYRSREYARVFIASIISVMVMISYGFLTSEDIFPARAIAIYFVGINFIVMIMGREFVRFAYRLLLRRGVGRQKVLIVGNDAATFELADMLSSNVDYGYDVVGIVAESGGDGTVNHFTNFKQAAALMQPDTIIQTDTTRSQEVYHYAALHHLSYMFVPQQDRMMSRLNSVEMIGDLPVIEIHQTRLAGAGRIVKRAMDVLLSLLALMLLSPVFLIISVIMKLTDPTESVFYRQTRLSRFNKRVGIYKFRSMKPAYNGLSPEEAFAKMNKPELTAIYRENGDQLDDDPRMSRLGKFLRATSLDELPQLYNVLKGDISLVGPRALVPQEINQAERKHIILSVKSGLTGLAQVSGRRDISFEERRRLDVYYVQNWSLMMDVQILFRTVVMVLFRRGAK